MTIIFKPDPIPEGEGTFEETVTKPLDTLTQTEQGTFSKWKTTIMNQLLLNEEVHVYDFVNAEPMLCDMFNGVPCCRPRDDFRSERGKDLPEDVQEWQNVWATKKKPKKMNCPENFGLEHDGKNACFMFDYDATCDGKFFTALIKPLTNSF